MNIVLVGVGGAGMSAIASLLHQTGFTNILGIDAQESQSTLLLADQGISIIIGHGKYQVQAKDIVIYSDIASIKTGPELQQAFAHLASRSTNTPRSQQYRYPLSYNQFLGELSKWFKTIAITGSKGKTSTSAMTIYAMEQHCKDFGVGIVGGMLTDYDQKNCIINTHHHEEIADILSYMLLGSSKTPGRFDYSLVNKYRLVLEACEYKEHFLLLDIDYAIITNTYRDHTDYFVTEQSYQDVFEKLRQQVKISTIEQKPGQESGDLFVFDHLFGQYHQTNARLISQLFDKILCFKGVTIRRLRQKYTGVGRRMEYLGRAKGGAKVYTDYGHTPKSLVTGLAAIHQQFPDQKVVTIFQPHQARRVLDKREAFVDVFGKRQYANSTDIFIYQLYTAREQRTNFLEYPIIQNNSLTSFDDLGTYFSYACGAQYVTDLDSLQEHITQYDQNTIVVLFTAGDLDFPIRQKIQENTLAK